MLDVTRCFVLLSILWAAIALIAQVAAARGGGREEYGQRSGSPGKGMLHNFTIAMLPWHKETVKHHPGKFAAGVIMHMGVILALADAVAVLIRPTTGLIGVLSYTRWLVACSLVSGVYLFVRRICSRNLRVMSASEDYVSILATCGLLAFALLRSIDSQYQLVFLAYVGLFFVFLPLGKLRHSVFFFVARGDYGRRLGYRSVYPPTMERTK